MIGAKKLSRIREELHEAILNEGDPLRLLEKRVSAPARQLSDHDAEVLDSLRRFLVASTKSKSRKRVGGKR